MDITITAETVEADGTLWRAATDGIEAIGKTAGEALDSLTTQLGKKQTLLVAPSSDTEGQLDFHLPSDLSGLTLITYRSFQNEAEMAARLGPACSKLRSIIKTFNSSEDDRLQRYMNVLSSGLIYLLRHLDLRALSVEDTGNIIASFNAGNDTPCKDAWHRAGKYAIRALTALDFITSDSHGYVITGLGRTVLENKLVKEKYNRVFSKPLVEIP